MQPTRLSRFKDQKTKRLLFIRLGGSIVILFLLIKFGIPGLINLSLFLENLHKDPNSSQTSSNTNTFLAAPFLDPTFSATSSASISVTGTATPTTEVRLYVNNTYTDSVIAGNDGKFSFSSVSLSDGNNSIQAKAKNKTTESAFSDPITVNYLHNAPKLDINSPHDGDQFDKNTDTATIKGTTDQNDSVTINGYRAIVNDDGTFSYTYMLKSGDNPLTIDAIDQAGNKTEKTMTIKSQK